MGISRNQATADSLAWDHSVPHCPPPVVTRCRVPVPGIPPLSLHTPSIPATPTSSYTPTQPAIQPDSWVLPISTALPSIINPINLLLNLSSQVPSILSKLQVTFCPVGYQQAIRATSSQINQPTLGARGAMLIFIPTFPQGGPRRG